MQAADLVGKIAAVMMKCGEEELLGHLGVILYEYLGEEYPEACANPFHVPLFCAGIGGVTLR